MLLCDIGNTTLDFLDELGVATKESVATFEPKMITQNVYFVSVNAAMNEKLKDLPNWINLKEYVDMSKYYETMGIDRICAVEAIESGVVVDAGSAITVDVVRDGVFMGGFIYPGVRAMSEAYKSISSALDYEFNFSLSLEILPKNSADAISYGFLKTLQREVLSHNLPVILTGGDLSKLHQIFPNATCNTTLIFEGMKNILSRKPHKSS